MSLQERLDQKIREFDLRVKESLGRGHSYDMHACEMRELLEECRDALRAPVFIGFDPATGDDIPLQPGNFQWLT